MTRYSLSEGKVTKPGLHMALFILQSTSLQLSYCNMLIRCDVVSKTKAAPLLELRKTPTHAMSHLSLLAIVASGWRVQSAQSLAHLQRMRTCETRCASKACLLTQICTCVHPPIGWMRWVSISGFIHPVGG
eukprot:55043-Eustigmatos_ZCMA.PRE.1